jgi:hypothetical protein
MVTPLLDKKRMLQKIPNQKIDEVFDRQKASAKTTDCLDFIGDCYIIL